MAILLSPSSPAPKKSSSPNLISGSGLSPLLSFDSIAPALDNQYSIAEERRKKETEKTIKDQGVDAQALRDGKAVSDQSMQASADVQRRQLEVLNGIDGAVEKSKRAMELSDSKDPMDRLTLFMLQQSDPQYTRDGNLRRIDYLNQAASAIGGIGAIQQQGYADKLKQIAANAEVAKLDGADDLALVKLRESQGQERIDAATNYLSTQAGMLQNQNSIREGALAQAPDEAIDAAVDQAKKSPKGTSNIAGVEIPLSFLEARQKDIADRKFLVADRSRQMTELELGNMTAKDVNEAVDKATSDSTGVWVSPAGTVIPLARLQERQAALTNQDYVKAQQAHGIQTIDIENRRRTDMNILGTMNPTELNQLLLDGGLAKNSVGKQQFDLDQVQAVLDTKKAAQGQQTSVDMLKQQGVLSEMPAVEHSKYLDSLHIDPTVSPVLSQLADRQRTSTRIAASILADPKVDDFKKVDMLTTLQASRTQMDDAIGAEALRLSGGDKDLAILQEARIRGTAVPQDIMEATILDRAGKNKPLAPFFDAQTNGVFQASFNNALAQMDNDPTAMGLTSADKRTRAAQIAMMNVKASSAGGVTEQITGSQATVPGNPLTGVISPQKFMVLAKQAEDDANRGFQNDNKLSDDDMLAKVTAGDDPALIQTQLARTMMELDKVKPGLGKQYMDWWNSPKATDYVSQFVDAQAAQQPNAQKLAQWSLIAPDIQGQMSVYGQSLYESYRSIIGATLQKEHAEYANFGTDPSVKQAYLLQSIPDLTDPEKQVAMTLMQPIIADAKAQKGLTNAQVSQYIEGRLRTFQPPTPEGAKVWNKMLANRDKGLTAMDNFLDAQKLGLPAMNIGMGGMFMAPSPPIDDKSVQVDSMVKRMQWYTDLGATP
jgi:hypothetical protein